MSQKPVVSINVAQLLQEAPGAHREFDFSQRIPAVSDEVHLHGPIRGHAKLMRTSEGILVTTVYTAPVTLECARCLDDVQTTVRGKIEEEFLPSVELRTGAPIDLVVEDEQLRIDEHHEIDLDEVLRQNILTVLPIQPLCDAACPGLCPTCGERLDSSHPRHAEEPSIDPANPFAQLATLLNENHER